MTAWAARQAPETVTVAEESPVKILGLTDVDAFTDLGDCIPQAGTLGAIKTATAFFAKTTTLPVNLSDTDFVTFDAAELARRGTASYDVEYPLLVRQLRQVATGTLASRQQRAARAADQCPPTMPISAA